MMASSWRKLTVSFPVISNRNILDRTELFFIVFLETDMLNYKIKFHPIASLGF